MDLSKGSFGSRTGTVRKVFRFEKFFSGPYFPVFGPNTEIFSVNIRIHSKHRKIRTRKTFQAIRIVRISAINEKHPKFLTTLKCLQLFYFRKKSSILDVRLRSKYVFGMFHLAH